VNVKANEDNKELIEKREMENYNSNISLNSNNNNSIIEKYIRNSFFFKLINFFLFISNFKIKNFLFNNILACCSAKEYSFENSLRFQEENNSENSDTNDDGLFNFKLPDNLINADEDYYVNNNVIRFGNK
jgi:uncharacterized protein YaiL (DUF2058 family)